MGSLFGGGNQDVNSTTRVELSPEQQRLISATTPTLESFVNQPPQLFPGSGIAGFTPLQEAGQAGVLQAASGPVANAANEALSAQSFLFGPALFPSSNPALQDAISAAIRPLERTFSQQVLPQIGRDAITSGQLGGSRQGIAEGIAGQSLLQGVGDVSAQVASQGFGQGLEALTRGLAFAPQTTNLAFAPSTAIEAVGSQQQGLQQQFTSEAQNRFLQEQLIPFLIAQDVARLSFGIPGGSATAESSIPGSSLGANVLGGATTGAALGTALGGPGVGTGLGALAGLFF